MLTVALPPKTAFSVLSALIIRLFLASCSLFFLMYAHSRLVTSVLGIGLAPITSYNAGLGVIGFMKAGLGFRADLVARLAMCLLSRRENCWPT